jgi:mannosyl-oligosaccharide alpha-1,2-mannosidase
MVHVRRLTVFLAITAVCLLLTFMSRRRVLPFPGPSRLLETSNIPVAWSTCPNNPPKTPFVISRDDGRFRWRDIAVKNPVRSIQALPTNNASAIPRIQHHFRPDGEERKSVFYERRDAVKQVFLRGWSTYRHKAWLHDELRPVSGNFKDLFGGWGATLVDNLDTLWIMDLKAEFEEAVTAAANISFSPDSSKQISVNMFETTIRYLGGFLAAFDLTDCKDMRLLERAVELGDMIYASYDTPNRMPVTRWGVRKFDQQQLAAENGIIAELASASLELTRLSQLTGDMRYYDAIARITNLLDEQQNRTQLPGMFPIAVNTRTGDITQGATFSFGSMADSAFEYFGKTWQLLGGRERQYQKLYEGAMDAAASSLLFRPSLPDGDDILFSANYHAVSGAHDNQVQHLACFAGGMYLLGGRLFGNETHIEIGKKLTNGCVWVYESLPNGIMPEVLQMTACPSFSACPYDPTQPSPFTRVIDPKYALRPEAVESVFYAYRITGDPRYQDIAWQMFQDIETHTQTVYGNAAIRNVTAEDVELDDSMESFWMSETLKYFYLLFSEPELVSLDEWVFNTEAHPFRLSNG